MGVKVARYVRRPCEFGQGCLTGFIYLRKPSSGNSYWCTFSCCLDLHKSKAGKYQWSRLFGFGSKLLDRGEESNPAHFCLTQNPCQPHAVMLTSFLRIEEIWQLVFPEIFVWEWKKYDFPPSKQEARLESKLLSHGIFLHTHCIWEIFDKYHSTWNITWYHLISLEKYHSTWIKIPSEMDEAPWCFY